MKNIKLFPSLLAVLVFLGCGNDNENIENHIKLNKDKTFFRISTEMVGEGFEHFVYVNEESSYNLENLNFTDVLQEYLDTASYSLPIKKVTFINSVVGLNVLQNEVDNQKFYHNSYIVGYWLKSYKVGRKFKYKIDAIDFIKDDKRFIINVKDTI